MSHSNIGSCRTGEVLAQMVVRRYGPPPGEGTRFCDCGAPEQALVLKLKLKLRDALSSLQTMTAEAQVNFQETCWSFRQHRTLFEELA